MSYILFHTHRKPNRYYEVESGNRNNNDGGLAEFNKRANITEPDKDRETRIQKAYEEERKVRLAKVPKETNIGEGNNISSQVSSDAKLDSDLNQIFLGGVTSRNNTTSSIATVSTDKKLPIPVIQNDTGTNNIQTATIGNTPVSTGRK